MRAPHIERPMLESYWRSFMPVAQKAVVAGTSTREFILRQLALLSAAALFVFVLSLTYGLDLSPGFF
ncbi:hypothetical protein N2603_24515 [Bradyrhizobium huanghuaihaiense]|nr:hypothetical protein [Bradyrhizobium sp. CB3035]UWU81599.1 hypothetical protein N2603_24515 [Bradyrhizobium sp. CB3035]